MSSQQTLFMPEESDSVAWIQQIDVSIEEKHMNVTHTHNHSIC